MKIPFSKAEISINRIDTEKQDPMELSSSDEENIKIFASREYLLSILVALICVGLGIFLDAYWVAETNIFFYKVVPFSLLEIGLAIFIALVLIRTIDGITRKREAKATQKTIEKINNNLFRAIFGRYIPDSLYLVVEECLMQSNVIRKNYEVTYHLEHLKDTGIGAELEGDHFECDNHVLCTVNSSYTITNTTSTGITKKLKTSMELPPNEKLHKHVKVLSLKIDSVEQDIEEINHNTKTTRDQKIHNHEVRFKGSEEIEVVTVMQIVKRTVDQEVWSSILPSEGIKLTVISPADLYIGAHACHHKELEGPEITQSHQKWKLNHGIFPYQSIVFWWFPKSINDERERVDNKQKAVYDDSQQNLPENVKRLEKTES